MRRSVGLSSGATKRCTTAVDPMRSRMETGLMAFGLCTVAAILWNVHERKTKSRQVNRPKTNEHEVQRFVARELERIRESLKSQR